MDGRYWDERACFAFDSGEIDKLEAVTEELHAMCLAAVKHVIAADRFDQLVVPPAYRAYVAKSWHAQEPSLYGRFDLSYDGAGEPKLLEYNADTPTSLIESAIAQWNWQQEVHPDRDQFNSLHEKLIERWARIRTGLPSDSVYFACVGDNEEDIGNLDYLRDTALQAGIDARFMPIEELGWDADAERFVDGVREPVEALFKLYPWEWMLRETFGAHLLRTRLALIEPPWKMLLSNKGILAILWELFPGHPNLLPAYFGPNRIQGDFVEKPLYSREGENVTIHKSGSTRHAPGRYGAEGYVYQAYAPLPDLGGGHVVLGAWVVGDQAAGLCVREDATPITRNTSRFLPHYF